MQGKVTVSFLFSSLLFSSLLATKKLLIPHQRTPLCLERYYNFSLLRPT